MTSTPIFTTAATAAAAAAADLGPESVQRKRLVRYFAGNRGVLLLLILFLRQFLKRLSDINAFVF